MMSVLARTKIHFEKPIAMDIQADAAVAGAAEGHGELAGRSGRSPARLA